MASGPCGETAKLHGRTTHALRGAGALPGTLRLFIDEVSTPLPYAPGADGIGSAFHRRATGVPPSRTRRGSAYRERLVGTTRQGTPLLRRSRPHRGIKKTARIAPAPVFSSVLVQSGHRRHDRLRSVAALQENMPADAAQEQQRGGDLAGLGDGRGHIRDANVVNHVELIVRNGPRNAGESSRKLKNTVSLASLLSLFYGRCRAECAPAYPLKPYIAFI
jgi:hypothetical protein